MELSRRDFIRTGSMAAVATIATGCGHNSSETFSAVGQHEDSQSDSLGINSPATAYEPSVRGESRVINQAPPDILPRGEGRFIRYIATDQLVTNFTIDDGPDRLYTPQLLDISRRKKVPMTHALIGSLAVADPEMVDKIVQAGCEPVVHTMYHTYDTVSEAGYMLRAINAVTNAGGVRPRFHKMAGLTRAQIILDTAARLGLDEVHTTIDTLDWRAERYGSAILLKTHDRNLHPGSTSQWHTGSRHQPTVDALNIATDTNRLKGYEMLNMSDMYMRGTPIPGTKSYASSKLSSEQFQVETSNVSTCTSNIDVMQILLDYRESAKWPQRNHINDEISNLAKIQASLASTEAC